MEHSLTGPLRTFDPKCRLDYAKDPIYRYIPFTAPPRDAAPHGEKTEKAVIDHTWVQRMRRLRQTQLAHLVYPGAHHTRFEHALGVMHLAGRFARRFYRQLCTGIRDSGGHLPTVVHSVHLVEEYFRLAGLLHDVGHGPLSHSFTQVLDRYYSAPAGGEPPVSGIAHEDVSAAIITSDLAPILVEIQRGPHGKFQTTAAEPERIRPDIVAALVSDNAFDRLSPTLPPEYFWVSLLRGILTGFFAADTLDYLMRDAHHAGNPEFGAVDVERLLLTSLATPLGICVHRSSVPNIMRMLEARLHAYEAVFYHKATRIFELEAQDLLLRYVRRSTPPHLAQDAAEFLRWLVGIDDLILHAFAHPQFGFPEDERRRWEAISNRRVEGAWTTASELVYRVMNGRLSAHNGRRYLENEAHRIVLEAAVRLRALPNEHLRAAPHSLSDAEVASLRSATNDELLQRMRFDFPALDPWHLDPESLRVLVYDPVSDRVSPQSMLDRLTELPVSVVFFRVFSMEQDLRVVRALVHEPRAWKELKDLAGPAPSPGGATEGVE